VSASPLNPPSLIDAISHEEELVNAATHALGFALALVAGAVLISTAARFGDALRVWACAIYSFTLITAYAASTMSHVARQPALRHAMRVADQAAIYLYIAGTWTPIAVAWLGGRGWWPLHAAVWIIALAGFVSKLVFSHRVKLGAVSAALYVALGWLPMFASMQMYATLPPPLFRWIVVGGLCYTIGLFFFHFDHRVRYFHAAWHLCVIAGSAAHYLGILWYCARTVV
jgi:hemolysin III